MFCQKGIDDVAQHYLAKRGILAVRRVKKSDMEKLAKATGAKLVTSLDDLTARTWGSPATSKERKIAGEQMVFVEKCKDPKIRHHIREGIDGSCRVRDARGP